MKKKLNILFLKSILPVAIAGFALFLTLFVEASNVFGWFASNKKVNASGMMVNPHVDLCSLDIAYGSFDGNDWIYTDWVELNESTKLDFLVLDIPNSVTRFKVRINNISESGSVYLTEFGFQNYTEEDEKPRIIDGINYYLGTQISVGVVGEEKKFMSNYEVGTDSLENTDKLVIFEGNEELAFGESYEIEIEALFNETDLDQSNYAEFGIGGECCKRKLYFIF